MEDSVFKLLSTIGIDLDQYERDLKSAEDSTKKSAEAFRRALSDIDIRYNLNSHRNQIAGINKEAKDLGISVRKYLSLGFAEGASTEAQQASKVIAGLVEARDKALGKSGGKGFGSETLLRQLDQLRIGSEQLSRGSLGGLPNIIKAVAISASEANVAAGALSSRVLLLGGAIGIAAIAATGGAVAFVKMANSASDAQAKLEKLQDSTGLSAERLQYLKAAASLTNVELASITSAYEKYTEAAHQANNGNKELNDIFKILGQTTKNTSEDSFEQFVKKLADISDESTRLEVAQRVLGGSSRDLQRFFEELNDEGGRLKNVLKESSQVMSGESLDAAKRYGQEVERLKLEGENLWNSISQRGIPILTDLASTLADVAIAARQFSFDNLQQGISEYFNEAMRAADRNKEIIKGLPTGSIQSVPNKPTADDILRSQNADQDVFPYGRPLTGPQQLQQKSTKNNVDNKLGRVFHPSSTRSRSGTGSRSKGTSDEEALNRSLLALEKARNETTLKLEQDRISRVLDANKTSLELSLRYTNDEIGVLEKYYNERLALQQDSISKEIESNQKYYLQLQDEQDKAKKKSEKIRIQVEKERIGERLRILNRDFSTTEEQNQAEKDKAISEAKRKQSQDVQKLVEAYKDLQGQIIELSGSDQDQFIDKLNKTTLELEHLIAVTGRVDMFPLIQQFKELSTQKFNLSFDNSKLNSILNLEYKKIANQEDLGLITRGEANKKILNVERSIGAELEKNLELQIKIAEANGKQLEALRLKSELEDVKLLGVDRERLRRLKEVRDSIATTIDETKMAIITGQVGLFDGIRQMAASVSTTILNELESQIIQRATGGKFSTVGEVIAASLGKILDKIFGKVNPAKNSKNPMQVAIERQNDITTSIGNQQIQQGNEIISTLHELANCSCASATQPVTDGFFQSVLKGAISGAISGAVGGIIGGIGGGNGESSLPSLSDNPNYTNIGRRAPLYIKRAKGGRFRAYDNIMVGEEGIEMVKFDKPGEVVSNSNLGREASNNNVVHLTQNFYISSTDGKYSRKSSQQLGMQAANGLQRAINRS